MLVQSTSTNIALLFVYAISLRFMSFYYFQDWWKDLVTNLYQKVQNSTKRTYKSKKDILYDFKQAWKEAIKGETISITQLWKEIEEDKQLLIYQSDAPQSFFWKGLYVVFDKLVGCYFCQGCWAGYLVYLLLVIDWSSLTLNIQQVVEFAFFSWSCGIISRLTTPKIDSL